MDRPVALQVKRDFVLAWRQPQPLERAVEIVDHAGVVAVDEDLRLFGFHFEPDRRLRRDVVVAIGAVRSVLRGGLLRPGAEREHGQAGGEQEALQHGRTPGTMTTRRWQYSSEQCQCQQYAGRYQLLSCCKC